MSILPYRAAPLPEEERAIHRKALAGAYTATVDDRARQLACSGTWTLTLPSAVDLGPGWWCYVENSGTGTITIDPEGSDTINSAATITLPPFETQLITCDGESAYRGTIVRQGAGVPANASFVIGEQSGSQITIEIQFLDEAGNDVSRRSVLTSYIASAADGGATTTVDLFESGANGALFRYSFSSAQASGLICEANGRMDVILSSSSAKTVYLCIVMPDASIVVSDAIEFV